MKIERERVEATLSFLQSFYPLPVESFKPLIKELGGANELTAYLVYLHDHGFIEGIFDYKHDLPSRPWDIKMGSIRINAFGLDHLSKLEETLPFSP
ncbi:hypothetical protein IAE49_10810 [Kosakonia sp. S58]|uniref:hypothetical protein n=1 Tax=unclassified Kosakonia TaxID=2632876 RepID=UPI0019061628|nr:MULTISPECIES: hypothetical protein [unclassified Kosakonia]MBK0079765.1 hypothetical protein [Kosakonia sp. S57]MBK0086725.1 hypothetical protein [Kosakonia sp. S58]